MPLQLLTHINGALNASARPEDVEETLSLGAGDGYDVLEARRVWAKVKASYGIGVERIMAAAIELHHDAGGILWPLSIAPYHATVLTWAGSPSWPAPPRGVCGAAAAGVDVLHDDRDERPGVKFKDADLIGIPIRIAVGKRGLADGKIEWKLRLDSQVELVALGELAARVSALLDR